MTIEIRNTRPSNPDVARRIAEAQADDINTYSDTGRDLDLWPARFAEPPASRLGERNPDHIPVPLRIHYWRTRDDDRRICDAWPLDRIGFGRDVENWPAFHGLLTPLGRASGHLTTHDPEFRRDRAKEDYLLHNVAMERAIASYGEVQRSAAEVKRDATERRCHACGITADPTVKHFSIAGWQHRAGRTGPRLCRACAHLAELEAVQLWTQRAQQHATEATPNGRRIDAIKAWIAENERKILP